MSTRYSLPDRSHDADVARRARTLGALVAVLAVFALSLWAVFVPLDEPVGVAPAPDVPVSAPIGGA